MNLKIIVFDVYSYNKCIFKCIHSLLNLFDLYIIDIEVGSQNRDVLEFTFSMDY